MGYFRPTEVKGDFSSASLAMKDVDFCLSTVGSAWPTEISYLSSGSMENKYLSSCNFRWPLGDGT
jgi:hypothetical protein